MNEIQVNNTLSGGKEPFVPHEAGAVTMYVCGVTTYDQSHLGHARPAVVFDVIRRYLRLHGLQVRMVQNFTDVDDKIIERAAKLGLDPLALSRQYCDEYLAGMDRLGVQRADVYPKVSEHMPEIIAMVQSLIDKGAAYIADGDVLFSVASFPEYGKLSKQKPSELESGTRIAVAENKRNPLDFALWKAAKPGEPAWDSPWGAGRPGWHIECSAMALKYLGNHLDIHGGGVDLVFPHHENEIAQSETYTGVHPFARYWQHNGLVNVGGEKMSKSLGNFISVSDALERYPAGLVRYYILSHHYRTPVDFDPARVAAAGKAWERLNRTVWDLEKAGVTPDWPGLAVVWQQEIPPAGETLLAVVNKAAHRLDAALADDFNTAAAIGIVFEVVAAVRATLSADPAAPGLPAALGFLREVAGDLLGVLAPAEEGGERSDLAANLLDLVLELRNAARQRRDWDTADKIRDKLKELGVSLEDTPQGTRWSL